jgi:hypothetical protein
MAKKIDLELHHNRPEEADAETDDATDEERLERGRNQGSRGNNETGQ